MDRNGLRALTKMEKLFEAGMIVKVKEIRGVTLYVTESDAMPKKAEEAEAPKESEQ